MVDDGAGVVGDLADGAEVVGEVPGGGAGGGDAGEDGVDCVEDYSRWPRLPPAFSHILLFPVKPMCGIDAICFDFRHPRLKMVHFA